MRPSPPAAPLAATHLRRDLRAFPEGAVANPARARARSRRNWRIGARELGVR